MDDRPPEMYYSTNGSNYEGVSDRLLFTILKLRGVETSTQTIVVMVMMSVFSLVGIVGNALVIYVFSQLKQKLTSTVFIISLAAFDLVTSLVAMPFTAVAEYLNFDLHFDGLCKFYNFSILAPVFFSAICFVGIAVDRYLCICHPFKHAMNIQRAKILVAAMATVALALGGFECLFFGVPVRTTFDFNNVTYNDTFEDYHYVVNKSDVIKQKAHCQNTYDIFDEQFVAAFQKFHSSTFLVACVIVAFLYALIYRTVIRQRRRKLSLKSNACCLLDILGCYGETDCCCSLWRHEDTDKMTQTEITQMVHIDATTTAPYEGNGEVKHDDPDTTINDQGTPGKNKPNRQGSIPRKSPVEKMRIANIRTAVMLSVVTLVYIVAFLPSWLMALRVLDMNLVVFYMYFAYNVANPFIYAFMNQNFRTQLKVLFNCSDTPHHN